MDIDRLFRLELEGKEQPETLALPEPGAMRKTAGLSHYRFGVHGARATPVSIPNTAVKPRRGYNTWGSPLGK